MVLPAEDQAVAKPDALVQIALNPDPAPWTLSPGGRESEDTIIANGEQLFDVVPKAIPRLVVLHQEPRELLSMIERFTRYTISESSTKRTSERSGIACHCRRPVARSN